MEKYIVNYNVHSYDKLTIESEEILNKEKCLIVMIVDKSCDTVTGLYYKVLDNLLVNRNRVILIGIDDNNTTFRPLASLMATFKKYDVYQTIDKETITVNYLTRVEERTPDYTEIQSFIGGDVTAYSDMTTILFGIESLVDEGNHEKLKDFLEEHMLSIENLTTTLNNMKKTCDLFNSNELVDNINKLKSKVEEITDTLQNTEKTLDEIKYDRDRFKVNAEDLKRENEKLKNNNNDLKNQAVSGASVIKNYQEINTQLINCKTKIIIYFKEISYVPYMNTLVIKLFETIKRLKLKVKLLVYDSQTELYNVYKPLNIVSGSDYLSNKGTLISKTEQFVVAEPSPSILSDILLSEQCFDVVILYDRMKGLKDIVSGNNVTKFYVINSSKEYETLKNMLKITDETHVISRVDSNVCEKGLDIPFIQAYKGCTQAAQTSKYIKLVTARSKLPLLKTIQDKSRVNTLI